MKGESIIHLKFEYLEALNGKKEILYMERSVINLMSSVKKYNSSRMDELKIKLKLHRKMKELINKIKSLEGIFPHFNAERILNKGQEKYEEQHNDSMTKKTPIKEKTVRPNNEIESQLLDIQKRHGQISR